MLKRTQDRKTANLSNKAGKASVIANAFSLPSGKSCPGMTSICEKVCYAGKLEKMYPSFRALVEHNFNLLKDASPLEMIELLSEMIADFRADCDKRGAKKLFRIHADGDYFNVDYAWAWKQVILSNPDIQFWSYTRSLFATHILNDILNHSLYFSTDDENQNLVESLPPGVKIAYLGNTFAEAEDQILNLTDKPAAACPELTGALSLIDERGGACVTCGLCVLGRGNVRFSVTNK